MSDDGVSSRNTGVEKKTRRQINISVGQTAETIKKTETDRNIEKERPKVGTDERRHPLRSRSIPPCIEVLPVCVCVYLCSCRLNLDHMLGKSQESTGSIPHSSLLSFIFHSDKERGVCFMLSILSMCV